MKKLLGSIVFVGIIFGLVLVLFSSLEEMKEGEYGVLFTSLPPELGGGISDKLIAPGEKEYVYPWERLYRVDTTIQSLTWGAVGEGDNRNIEDYVETRSIDGNEVGLAMTVQYSVEPDKVPHLIKYVGTDQEKISELVTTLARADIRTHMNALDTRDFFDSKKRNKAVEGVKDALNFRLNDEGIVIRDVIFHDYRFERKKEDGGYDRAYQEQIDQEQSTRQKIEQERQRIQVVKEQKLSELEQARAKANRTIEKAKGQKRQAEYRGSQYLEAKKVESTRIANVGENEIAALKKQIEALNGPGGEALLKMEIAKNLIKSKSKFILLNSGTKGGSGIDVNKIDTNELIKQAGIFTALEASKKDSENKEKPSDRK